MLNKEFNPMPREDLGRFVKTRMVMYLNMANNDKTAVQILIFYAQKLLCMHARNLRDGHKWRRNLDSFLEQLIQ